MKKSFTPIILILGAFGLFFAFIDPTYQEVKILEAEENKFDQALDKSKELQAVRDKLLSKYNTFSNANLSRLNKLLPDNVDNVRLILDIDSIAAKYGMRVKNVTISEENTAQEVGVIVTSDGPPFASVLLNFTVASSYEDVLKFIKDLETSLRIVDVTSVSFSSAEGDIFEYSISVKTYWLK